MDWLNPYYRIEERVWEGKQIAADVKELIGPEVARAYEAVVELRPGRPYLATVEAFCEWVESGQRPEGYRMVASFVAGRQDAVAVAGFRHLHSLAWGHYLYVDDLATVSAFRGQGHADALFDWLFEEAKRLGCEEFHLDSGMNRHAAHRFYLNHHLEITALHFRSGLHE